MERNACIPSLYTPNLPATITFYVDRLGFAVTGTWDEDGALRWAEVSCPGPVGTARVWLFADALDGRPVPALTGVLYLFLGPVLPFAERLAGLPIVRWGPEVQPYGLRELGIEDPNGYLLCLAEDVVEAASAPGPSDGLATG